MQTKVLRPAVRPTLSKVTTIRVNYEAALGLLKHGLKARPGEWILLLETCSPWAKQNMATQVRKLDPWSDFSFTRTVSSEPGNWDKVYQIWGRIDS